MLLPLFYRTNIHITSSFESSKRIDIFSLCIKFKIRTRAFFKTMLIIQMFSFNFTCGKYLQNDITIKKGGLGLKDQVYPYFNKVFVPSQESELSGVSIDSLSVTFLLIIPYLKISTMKVDILTAHLYLLTTDIKYLSGQSGFQLSQK